MKHSKTSLFLMEFIVGILFFSIALALCVQLFVKAKTINEESVQKSKAQLIAGYIIENYKADQSLENSMNKVLFVQKITITILLISKNRMIFYRFLLHIRIRKSIRLNITITSNAYGRYLHESKETHNEYWYYIFYHYFCYFMFNDLCHII